MTDNLKRIVWKHTKALINNKQRFYEVKTYKICMRRARTLALYYIIIYRYEGPRFSLKLLSL